MKTILLDEAHIPRFDQTDPTAAAEESFERTVLRMLSRLYPSCHVIPFKPRVVLNGVGWRPDLAVIDRECAYWFVVEVETVNHSLEKHVLPQVIAFRDGDYGADAAEVIGRMLGMSPDKTATLVRYVPRYVAVVSNHEDETWNRKLSAENIQYLSVASYERTAGPPAFLVTGLLRVAERCVGFGVVLASHQAIRLQRNDFWRPGTYRVIESDGTGDWDCFVDDGGVWLTKRRGVIKAEDKTWAQLIAQDDDLLLLRPL